MSTPTNEAMTLLDSMINQLEINTGVKNQSKTQTSQPVLVPSQPKEAHPKPTANQPQKQTQPPNQQVPAKLPKEVKEPKQPKEPKEPKQPKQPKEPKQPKAPKAAPKANQAEGAGDDEGPGLFAQLDIRIGNIVECWKHPASENLYCEKIDVGGEVREIASGLQKFVPIQGMKGPVIVMANLKPRPLAGFNSNGMVVCASDATHTNVVLIRPEGQVGERVYLEGHQPLFPGGPVLAPINPKKKILQRCLQHFKTDGEGNVTWKGIRVRTQSAFLKSQIPNGNVA